MFGPFDPIGRTTISGAKISPYTSEFPRVYAVSDKHAAIELFVAQTRVLPFLNRPSQLPLDVVLAGPGLEEVFLGRVRWTKVEGLEIPLISPEDLVATKILAGRAKDLDDVRGVLRRRKSELDLAQVRATLALLEEALGQSDLSPLLEAELEALES